MTNRIAAINVIRRLRRSGFEALMAGGCVRDMLLGRRPSDYDVATDARPEQVIGLFRRTVKVGAQFGVVIVLVGKQRVEVATFRTESDYPDGRHPAAVAFTGAAEDASRRDFTINGMFFDPLKRHVIDYVNGRADLDKRLIRTIGDPRERFAEDHLRMLRAVRFSAQLGFKIEPATFRAIRDRAEAIKTVSAERIAMELEGILTCRNRASGLALLIESGLARHIFEGFAGKPAQTAVRVLRYLPKRAGFALGLAGLFAAFGTDYALARLKGLKLSRNQNKHVKYLLANRGRLLKAEMSLAELKQFLAEPYFEDLFALQRAIQKAHDPGRKSIGPLIALRRRINALGDVELRPAPLLDGHELISLGAVPGPALGRLAAEMYRAQLEGHLKTPRQARAWVRRRLAGPEDTG